jgi:nicotinamidase/pyrazinamidase
MRIFYVVDTQNDFMNKDGALYVPDAELIKPNLKLLTRYASKRRIFVLGSVDNHFGTPEYKEREMELSRWKGPFPDHCMNGTYGQKIIQECILQDPQHAIYIPNLLKNRPEKQIERAIEHFDFVNINKWTPVGVFFEKQSYDVFTNPFANEIIDILKLDEAVVYGVATDYCVKSAVLGMQEKGIQCYVVEDAIKGVSSETTKLALDEMVDAKAKFVTTKDVLERRLL